MRRTSILLVISNQKIVDSALSLTVLQLAQHTLPISSLYPTSPLLGPPPPATSFFSGRLYSLVATSECVCVACGVRGVGTASSATGWGKGAVRGRFVRGFIFRTQLTLYILCEGSLMYRCPAGSSTVVCRSTALRPSLPQRRAEHSDARFGHRDIYILYLNLYIYIRTKLLRLS